MQTFMPYPDFKKSALCLDSGRLGKQRVEAAQIITILSGNGKVTKTGKVAWINHPAVRQWDGYLDALKLYFNTTVTTWVDREYNNSYPLFEIPDKIVMPPWIGCELYHQSHRANLLRKKFDHYSKFGWTEDPAMPYFWPSKDFKG